jgi:hypothetical protein
MPAASDMPFLIPEWDLGRETYAASNVRIGALVDRGITTFSYTYDFGDDWRHSITVEAVTDADRAIEYPRFVDGDRRAPPEDVGGLPGFEDFLNAMAKPRHAQHREVVAGTAVASSRMILASIRSMSG